MYIFIIGTLRLNQSQKKSKYVWLICLGFRDPEKVLTDHYNFQLIYVGIRAKKEMSRFSIKMGYFIIIIIIMNNNNVFLCFLFCL